MKFYVDDSILNQKDSNEEEIKDDTNIRMVPDGSSLSSCSSDSTVDIGLSSDNIQSGSVDSVTDVGKSSLELTTPDDDQRYDKLRFHCFFFKNYYAVS